MPGTPPSGTPPSDTPPPGPRPSGPSGPSGPGAAAELRVRVPKLLEAMRSVGSGLELHSTLERICRTAADLADARYAALGVVAEDAEDGDGLAYFVHHGVDEATARRIGRPPDPRTGLLGALTDEPGPVRPAGLTADPRTGGLPGRHPPMRGFLGVPVRVQGEIFGTLYLAGKRGDVPFDDHDLALVRVLATEAGIAIGNARLYEAARQRERWIDGSVAVTTALLSGADADDSLQVVAEQARRLSRAVAGIVLLPAAGGGMEIAAVAARRPTEFLGTVVPPHSGLVADLLAGRSTVVDDAATDPRLVTGRAGSGRSRAPSGRSPTGSPHRPRWPWSWRRRSATGNGSPCTRTATASPATCTSSSSSGCSRPG